MQYFLFYFCFSDYIKLHFSFLFPAFKLFYIPFFALFQIPVLFFHYYIYVYVFYKCIIFTCIYLTYISLNITCSLCIMLLCVCFLSQSLVLNNQLVLFFLGEGYFSHTQHFLVACSSLCGTGASWAFFCLLQHVH